MLNKKNLVSLLCKAGILTLFVMLLVNPVFAQLDLTSVEAGLNNAKTNIRGIILAIISIIFLAGVIHVAIAFSQGQQNAKDVGMKYFAGIIIFSVIWVIIP